MDSNHPRRLYESRVLPTELASRVFLRKLAGRAGFEPAHDVSNSHVPFRLGYRPKSRRPRFLAGAFEKCLNLETENGQTNPECPARLTRRLIMDLVFIVIFVSEYSTPFRRNSTDLAAVVQLSDPNLSISEVAPVTRPTAAPGNHARPTSSDIL